MARYLLVQVDKNETADRLREKLDAVAGLKVIAKFGKPTRFCECLVDTGRSVLGKKFGWWCCPTCGNPKQDAMHYGVVNLLDDPTPPVEYRTIYLGIREPYRTPEERTGRKVILIKLKMIADNWIKIQNRKKRRPRARR